MTDGRTDRRTGRTEGRADVRTDEGTDGRTARPTDQKKSVATKTIEDERDNIKVGLSRFRFLALEQRRSPCSMYGRAWHGAAWHGMARRGTAWRGIV